jgi:hypothetical protein
MGFCMSEFHDLRLLDNPIQVESCRESVIFRAGAGRMEILHGDVEFLKAAIAAWEGKFGDGEAEPPTEAEKAGFRERDRQEELLGRYADANPGELEEAAELLRKAQSYIIGGLDP